MYNDLISKQILNFQKQVEKELWKALKVVDKQVYEILLKYIAGQGGSLRNKGTEIKTICGKKLHVIESNDYDNGKSIQRKVYKLGNKELISVVSVLNLQHGISKTYIQTLYK